MPTAGINLLPKDSFEFSTLGKLLKWSLTTGRAMIVLTEFVVILAFGSRFYFDKRLNDLLEVIDQKQVVVDSYAEIEKMTRAVLAKQEVVDKYLKTNLQFARRIDQMKQVTPIDITFSEINIDDKGIHLVGVAGSESGLANLIAGVSGLADVESISIGGVEFDQGQGILKFDLEVSIAKAQT